MFVAVFRVWALYFQGPTILRRGWLGKTRTAAVQGRGAEIVDSYGCVATLTADLEVSALVSPYKFYVKQALPYLSAAPSVSHSTSM